MRPRQGAPGSGRKRRVVIDSGAARPRQDSRQRRDDTPRQPKQPREVVQPTGPVTVESGVTVQNLSQALGVTVPKLITILMGLGAPKTVTQSLSDEEVELIAAEVGREINIKHAADEEEILEDFEDAPEDLVDRVAREAHAGRRQTAGDLGGLEPALAGNVSNSLLGHSSEDS